MFLQWILGPLVLLYKFLLSKLDKYTMIWTRFFVGSGLNQYNVQKIYKNTKKTCAW